MVLAESWGFLLVARISNILSALRPASFFLISLPFSLALALPLFRFLHELKAHAALLDRDIVVLIAEVTIEQILVILDELHGPMGLRLGVGAIIEQLSDVQFLEGVGIAVHVNIIGRGIARRRA